MKTIKKCVLSSAVALALASSASFAEESGAFVGVGVGYGGSQVKSGEKMNLDGISYEIIAGYKHSLLLALDCAIMQTLHMQMQVENQKTQVRKSKAM